MNYQEKITLKVPLLKFMGLLDSLENMKYWLSDLQSHQLESGEPGAVGSTMRLTYLQGKRPFTLTETITKNDFPLEFIASYECIGVFDRVKNTFSEYSLNE